jgi:Nucleotidyl transferase AbiEii toxin, Type IV TA system
VSSERPSEWKRLFRIARDLIDQANRDEEVIRHWTFGGGTAMMLQIGHRESRDVDIFLPDPQLLPFLNPETHDFAFELMPDAYKGDGSRFLKIAFSDIGEIDFIAAPDLTNNPTVEREVEGTPTLLETVPEIIAKKIFHRGASIKPRDIFDIAAAGIDCRDEVIAALALYPEKVTIALATMEKLNPQFIDGVIPALMIRDEYRELGRSCLQSAKELLEAARI